MDLFDFVKSAQFINFAKTLDTVAPLTTIALIALLISREMVEVAGSSRQKFTLRLLNLGLVPIALVFGVIFVVKVLLTFV